MNLHQMSSEILLGQGREDTAAVTIVKFHVVVHFLQVEQHARDGRVRLEADETFAGVRGMTHCVLLKVSLPSIPFVTMLAFKSGQSRGLFHFLCPLIPVVIMRDA